jgi:putative transposase
MPRVGRKAPGGRVYHVINRGNGRARLLHKPGDFDAFVRLLALYRGQVGMRVLGFCLMGNHWHLVLWPRADGDLSRFMLRLTTAHVRRHHAHYNRSAGGHLYQGRFKSFPVQPDDEHLRSVLRYVEANPVRARLVRRGRAWGWSSLRARARGESGGVAAADLLDDWPVDVPADWEALVDAPQDPAELEQLRAGVNRGRPLGDPAWVAKTAAALGLEFTLRGRGRPPKRAAAKGRKGRN